MCIVFAHGNLLGNIFSSSKFWPLGGAYTKASARGGENCALIIWCLTALVGKLKYGWIWEKLRCPCLFTVAFGKHCRSDDNSFYWKIGIKRHLQSLDLQGELIIWASTKHWPPVSWPPPDPLLTPLTDPLTDHLKSHREKNTKRCTNQVHKYHVTWGSKNGGRVLQWSDIYLLSLRVQVPFTDKRAQNKVKHQERAI